MTKVYIAEYAGLAPTAQSDSVPVVAAPPIAEQTINTAVNVGAIATLSAISAAGTLYTNGTYNNVPLTGGTGTGATANITVAGGGVTAVTIVNRGTGYTTGDVLSANSANIGGTGSGFTVPVNTVFFISAPFQPTTAFVEISADAICSISIATVAGTNINKTRLNANERLPLRGVPVNQGYFVTAINNT